MINKCLFCYSEIKKDKYCISDICGDSYVHYYNGTDHETICDFYAYYNNRKYIIAYSKTHMMITSYRNNSLDIAIALNKEFDIIITPQNYQEKLSMFLTFS